MNKLKIWLCSIIAVVFEMICKVFNKISPNIKVLVMCMILDIITGMIKSYLGKSEKSKQGYLDSTIMWQGGIKKILVFIVISIAYIIQPIITPGSNILSNLTITYYITTETLSILENISVVGVSLPKPLIEVLDKLKESANNEYQ